MEQMLVSNTVFKNDPLWLAVTFTVVSHCTTHMNQFW